MDFEELNCEEIEQTTDYTAVALIEAIRIINEIVNDPAKLDQYLKRIQQKIEASADA